MSAREILGILRDHSKASVRNVPGLKALLRDLLAYNKRALATKPAHGATLRIEGNHRDLDARVPLRLWPAVFPWEAARGLSHTPAAALRPTPAAAATDGAAARVAAEQRSVLHNSRLNPGMLFVLPEVDYRRPVAFWSGAITAPLDVAFLQPFREDSIVQRLAALAQRPEGPPRKLHVGDIGCLATRDDAAGPHQVQSQCVAVEMVLEMRKGWFGEVFRALFPSLEAAAKLPECRMTLELGEELREEIAAKAQLNTDFINGVELHVTQAIQQCNAPPSSSESPRGDGPDGAAATGDASASFVGSVSDAARGRPSAAAESRLPRTSATMPQLPPLDYELLALAYQLNLGMAAIGRCSNRVVAEVQQLAVSDADLTHLRQLAADPAIDLYPPELGPLILTRAP